jgi:hypothetical protein
VPVFNTSNDLLMISLAFGLVHQPSGRTSNSLSLSRISIGNNALKADFLDLTLEIKNGHIVTKTYEKPTNLFLYIPPTSANSPGVLKSIIFGNVHHYWYQNSNIDDYRYSYNLTICFKTGSPWSCKNGPHPYF